MSWYGMAITTPWTRPDDPWLACRYKVKKHPMYFDCFNCQHNDYCSLCKSIMLDLYIQLMKEGKHQDPKILNQFPQYWKYVFAGQIKDELFPNIEFVDVDGIFDNDKVDELEVYDPDEVDKIVELIKEVYPPDEADELIEFAKEVCAPKT